MKKIYTMALAAVMSAMAAPAFAQAENPETLYLVKENRVVGKYDVNAVDYVTFDLPAGVVDAPIWLTVDNVGKNTVTYTVNTQDPNTAYAHNIVSYYTANVMALSYYGESIDDVDQEVFDYVMRLCLQSSAYMGIGTDTYTQTDYQEDGTGTEYYTSRFSVQPGTLYYLAVWEIDPVTQEPKETIDTIKFTTLDPGVSPYEVKVKSLGQSGESIAFDFTGTSDQLLYVTTVFGMKNQMDAYVETYGKDSLFGSWGQSWSVSELMEDARWMGASTGEYVMYCRGVDADGNISEPDPVYASYVEPAGEGPVVTIFSKTKGNGHVNVNFEIAPSNVSEAYVYLDTENNVDDMKNDGWELWEIASRSSATDICNEINTMGEYTYDSDVAEDEWLTLLIYARDKDGNRTVCRINFNTFEGTDWNIVNPAKAPRKSATLNLRTRAGNPAIRK